MTSTLGTFADLIRGSRPRNLAPVPYSSRLHDVNLLAPLKTSAGGGATAENLSALGASGTLFAIVDACAHGTSLVKWCLYRKPTSGQEVDPKNRVKVPRHAVLDLLARPNAFTTSQELVEAGQQHHELTGETILLVYRSAFSPIPLELWNVRPDKMTPVPHPTKFLAGWVYNGPDGEKIPLKVDEVIFIRRPSPLDPWRGMSQVGSVLADLEGADAAAQWQRTFFKNSAEPGGIIEFPEKLSDQEFEEFRDRWEEMHKGVSRAHRVAILEGSKWIDRKYSMKDMTLVELRGDAREIIREAYRFPKPMLGTVDDVNRANAEAGEYVFGQWLIKPRAERWKAALNNDLLPMFFPPGVEPDVEFDFELDIPADAAAEAAALTAKVDAVVKLKSVGFDPVDAAEKFDLPEIKWEEPPPPPAPILPGEDDGDGEEGQGDGTEGDGPPPSNTRRPARRAHWHAVPRASRPLPMRPQNAPDLDRDDLPGLDSMSQSYDEAIDGVLGDWQKVDRGWKDQLVEAAGDAVRSGTALNLAQMGGALDILPGSEILEGAMVLVANAAGHDVVAEAEAQGVTINAISPRRDHMTQISQAVVALLAQEIGISAGREALRVAGPMATAEEVAESVRLHLNALTDMRPRTFLGNALVIAQHQGRLATMRAAPVAAYYGNEVLDNNTCKYCRRVDGRWLGNDLGAAEKLYPNGGYIDCEGGVRCRGTIVAVYRPEQTEQTAMTP